ncbi:MAG TPA: glutathione peroxidase [Cyclobacteriaceae bacterium]|jgi:glutathione peroxidase|nr:glutathione peroxidase [Cytophagales bacterium]HMR58376.1 glutathione peroxidase [Cyclobacteriaceae bacterium]HNT48944.1 glutathione peroxidase [Cyclobacteriaceae bacterium]HRE65836.1 glutathione peroxidase [Cyclobacteriaceae bacterium]HRF33680.1 glutathione peroxidase [Cyclobacteriaceae bacterium]
MKLAITLLLAFVMSAPSVYDFKINGLDGKQIDFSAYKGKTLLIVNTASKCGFTPQYEDLQKLNEQYGSKVVVLGFPANNFKGQEPGSNLEIAEFCKANYGVTFQMFEKISVIGADQHPLYALLKEKTGQEPTWNFCKYLVKPDGTVKFFNSKVKPLDPQIVDEL